jgi:hypothetical protein
MSKLKLGELAMHVFMLLRIRMCGNTLFLALLPTMNDYKTVPRQGSVKPYETDIIQFID